MLHWLRIIWNLVPISVLVDFIEEWLSEMAAKTDNVLDDFAVTIIITMLRAAFNLDSKVDHGTADSA